MKILENIKFREELIIVLSHIEGKNIEFRRSKEELADKIIRKIYHIVEKYIDILSSIDEEVLFQEAYQALLEVAAMNNSRLMGGFEAHAMMAISSRIKTLILKNKFDVPMYGDESKKLLINIMDIVNDLTNSLGRTPTTYEIANELGEKEEDIKRISFIHNSYRYATNLSGIELAMEETYSKEDEIQFDKKDIITKLLNDSNLNEQELSVILLYFGIVPKNKTSICYNGKDIVLDGIPKSKVEIGTLLSMTDERVRQILSIAYYKLETSNDGLNLGISEYAINPDLALKLQSIYSWISTIPYTDRYPNFKSYFDEYTEEEFNIALNKLNKKDLLFIMQINAFNKNVTGFHYGMEEIRKLYTIIKNTYNNLINLYGKRNMIIEFCPYENKQYGHELDKMRDFFKNISNGDEMLGLYAVTKLSGYQREILFQICGNDLSKVFKPFEILKYNRKTILAYEYIATSLRKMTSNFKEDKCLIDIELMKTKLFIQTKQNENEQGIYRFLGFAKSNIINEVLNVLFIQELNVLKEVFGKDLKDNDYLENFNKLSIIKQATFVNIITNLINCLKERLKEEKANIRKQKRVEAFYEIFFYEGYLLEEIDDVFKNVIGLNIIIEYLKRGTSQERRTQIVELISKELFSKYGENLITRYTRNIYTKRELILSRTYNSLIFNI